MSITDPRAVIRLSQGRYDVDWARFFQDLLFDNWREENNDNSKPEVVLQEETKKDDFTQDTIRLYIVTNPSRTYKLGNLYKDQTIVISMEFFCRGDRPHMLRMLGEAERIVQQHAVDTVNNNLAQTNLKGRMHTDWGIRSILGDKNTNGFYKAVVDSQVTWKFRKLEV